MSRGVMDLLGAVRVCVRVRPWRATHAGGPGGIREGFMEEVSLEEAVGDEKELPGQQSGEAGHLGQRHSGPPCGVWGMWGGGAESLGACPGVFS